MGNETFEGEATGEMVYRGENVTLGYAHNQEDLKNGDENHGIMHTGDVAHRDNGYGIRPALQDTCLEEHVPEGYAGAVEPTQRQQLLVETDETF
jgi:acyl-CoA synthetase (AMP-forming)/AMP-acid ligase II